MSTFCLAFGPGLFRGGTPQMREVEVWPFAYLIRRITMIEADVVDV